MRAIRGWILAVAALPAACAEPPPPPLPPKAKLCDVQLSLVTPFGGAWRMTMSNEGGGCWMDASRNGPAVVSTSISEPATHGEAQSAMLSLNFFRVVYRPNPGFMGEDRFTVRMEPYTFNAPVIVTVVAAPSGNAPLAAGAPNR